MVRDITEDNTYKMWNTGSIGREVGWPAKNSSILAFDIMEIQGEFRLLQPKLLDNFVFVMEFQMDIPPDFGSRFDYVMRIYLP
jgi:hypothetical protein